MSGDMVTVKLFDTATVLKGYTIICNASGIVLMFLVGNNNLQLV